MFYVQVTWLDSAEDVNKRASTSNAVLQVQTVQDSSATRRTQGPSRIQEETSSSDDINSLEAPFQKAF